MPRVRELAALRPEDIPTFGGKSVHCGLLHQAGFAVPPSIAIAFEANEQSHLPDEVREWLRPQNRLAVRSSAPGEDGGRGSFAGVHESVLNVKRDDIEKAIEECIASMTSDRARLYRKTHNLGDATGAGVLIQQMIDPVRAGVAFTADPVTGDENTIVINSTAGLADAVVAGSAPADEQRIRKDAERTPLIDVLLRIEKLYGAPQDIEWCDDGATIWIVQSRPITTLLNGDRFEWTRANLREVLPELVPHGVLHAILDMLTRAYAGTFGALSPPEMRPFLRTLRGRLYFNLTMLRHVAHVSGISEATILRSLGHADEITADEEKLSRPRIGTLLRAWPMIRSTVAFHLRPRRTVERAIADVRAVHARLRAKSPRAMSDAELRATLETWVADGWRSMSLAIVLGSVMSLERMIAAACEKRGIDSVALLQARLSAGEKSVTSRQAFDLIELARVKRDRPHEFDAAWRRFLAEYGHRGVYETDWSRPRSSEDPAPLLNAIDAHLASNATLDPAELEQRQERTWQAAWNDARHRLGPIDRARVAFLLGRVKRMYVWRERFRSEMVRVSEGIRPMYLELASRLPLDDPNDIFLLEPAELGDPRVRAIARARRAQQVAFSAMEAPLLVRSQNAERRTQQDTAALRGLCVSRGVAEGVVAVLRDPRERMEPGAILVTQATDPSWTPLFT
ncbi:MAG TPA: PEP/pyruvate-binding domain-containing protein, partial [Thermoanaerobaculia bacterium]|nr:PEP/pyruvate-binding domain-containing protein [Thermoanaerobaculia bacterium]